jgi:hypothetical protein
LAVSTAITIPRRINYTKFGHKFPDAIQQHIDLYYVSKGQPVQQKSLAIVAESFAEATKDQYVTVTDVNLDNEAIDDISEHSIDFVFKRKKALLSNPYNFNPIFDFEGVFAIKQPSEDVNLFYSSFSTYEGHTSAKHLDDFLDGSVTEVFNKQEPSIALSTMVKGKDIVLNSNFKIFANGIPDSVMFLASLLFAGVSKEDNGLFFKGAAPEDMIYKPVYCEQYVCGMSIIPTMDSSSTLSGFDLNSGSLAGDSVNTGDNSAASIIRRKNILQSNSLLGNLSAFCQKAITVATPVLSSIGVALSKLQHLDIRKFKNKHEYRKLLEEGFAATYISAKVSDDESINSKYVESNSNFGLFSRDSKHPVNRWMPVAASIE